MKALALIFAAAAGLTLCCMARDWNRRARTLLTLLFAALVLTMLSACASAEPPAPVAVQAITLEPVQGEIRKAVRANDQAALHAERARLALERAERLLVGNTFSK